MNQYLYLDSDDEGTQNVNGQFISSEYYDFFNKIREDAIYEYIKVRKKSTGEIYTAKTLKKEDIDIEKARNFMNEVEFLHHIKSQFVIKCLGFNLGDESQTPFYIFEYYSNGTLSDLFKSKKKDQLTDFEKKLIIYGIASSMMEVHENEIVHRDLKPDNIYIDDKLLPKVAGFDLAILKENISKEDDPVGTMQFMAPEVLNEGEDYDQSIDVYAFSLVLYFICTNGNLPKISMINKMKGVIPEIPKTIPHKYAELIIRCMSFDPKERPSFKDIVSLLESNEFFNNEREKIEFFNYINGKDGKSAFEQLDIKQYDFVKLIYSDYSGDYFEVRDENTLKLLAKKSIINEANIKDVISNIEIVAHFNSNFIVQYKGYSINNNEDEIPQLTIFYNYYQNTLYDFISNTNDCTETTKLQIIYGIASEMAHIHSEGIIHTCLNPKCIYIDNDFLPRIANFDVFQFFKDVENSCVMSSDIIQFLAPELLNDEIYDQSIDVYSFSIILYFICTGELPKIQMNSKLNGKIPSIPDSVPNHYARLIKRCMSFDPKKRPSFEEIATILKSNEFVTNKINEKEFSHFIKKYDQIFEKINIEYTGINKLEVDFDQIDLSLYEKKSFIGSGSYGDVYKVKEKSSNTIYAAKINHLTLDDCRQIHLYNLSREINIISKLKNVLILKFIGYSEYNFNGEKCPTIITEFSKNNSLGSIIDLQSHGLTPPEWSPTKSLICAYGIAAGMSYMHSLDILHRDLKPENVFLDEYLHPKIGDFGLSKEISDESVFENDGYVGTPVFISPEIFDSLTYSKAGDVYAYAILLYELFTNEFPYHEIGVFQLMVNVISGKRPEFKYYIPECYKNLIEKCWSNDPNKRPTFDEIMSILEDDEFITDEIDKVEYQDYISFIKNQKIKKPFNQIKIDFETLQKKLINEYSSKIICIDLRKYIKGKFIRREGNFKVYEIKNKETNEVFEAKKSTIIIFYLSSKEMIHLQREINILSKLKHPLFLKFIGLSLVDFQYRPMPVLVTEIPPNNSLFNLLQMERNNEHNEEWDDTEKLITIYGIASGMSYLHSHEVIHRNLSPESIFFDEYLHPKIGNFGLLTQIHSNKSITHQTTIGVKGNIVYASPELLENYDYSKSSDVYAFSLIVYEIMTNKIPFEKSGQTLNSIYKEVVTKNNRPKFDVEIPECYRNLIEECWSQNPDDRPTFEMIENILISNSSFITKTINKTRFRKYVNFIQKTNIQFYSENKGIELDDLISKKKSEEDDKSKNKEIKNDDSKSKEELYEKNDSELVSKTKVHKELKNKKSLVDIKKFCEDLLQKKYIRSIDLEHMNYLLDKSELTGTSLTGEYFKVKIGETETDDDFISLNLFKKNVKKDEIDIKKIEEFCKIYEIINDLSHPNIIKSLGFYKGDKKHSPAFLFEYYSKPLFEAIKTLDDVYLVTIIYEISHAMMIAHSHDLIHRNLNIDNIFIDCNNHAKIRGFGTPVLIDQTDQVNYEQNVSLFCLPRELLQYKEYTEKVDVFAFGMITLYILRRGIKPFLERDEIHEGKKAKIPKSINKLSLSIISRCLSHSQEERPSFRAIIHTIKRHNFKMINCVDDKIEIIKNQLKSILRKRKKSSSSKIKE